MSYTPFVIDRFGGLNFVDDPQEVGTQAALDARNVDIDARGRLRTRDGLSRFSTSAPHTYVKLIQGFPLGSFPFLLVWNNAGTYTLDQVDTSGAVTALGALSTAAVTDNAVLGTPTVTYLFVAQGGATLKKYDGTSLSSSNGKPYYVAVTPADNRLVQARYTSAADVPTAASNGSDSTVYFSDVGSPDTYTAGDNPYVHLHPGDGEKIAGLATWRDLLFVFKQTRAFVFYGTSTDGTGKPIFNYRTITLPERLRGVRSENPAVVAGSDGVYFVATDGVYVTDGGSTRSVSDAIEPFFTGAGSPPVVLSTVEGLEWVGQRLYLRFTATDAGTYTLVYDRATGQWLWWDNGVIGYAEWPVSATARPGLYGLRSNYVVKSDLTVATDDGAAIASYYQSGFYDMGGSEVKTIRESFMWGSGSPTLAVFTDHATTDSDAAVVTLGASPVVDEGYQRISRKGVLFSHKISASSGAWSVNRLTHYVRETRVAGVR